MDAISFRLIFIWASRRTEGPVRRSRRRVAGESPFSHNTLMVALGGFDAGGVAIVIGKRKVFCEICHGDGSLEILAFSVLCLSPRSFANLGGAGGRLPGTSLCRPMHLAGVRMVDPELDRLRGDVQRPGSCHERINAGREIAGARKPIMHSVIWMTLLVIQQQPPADNESERITPIRDTPGDPDENPAFHTSTTSVTGAELAPLVDTGIGKDESDPPREPASPAPRSPKASGLIKAWFCFPPGHTEESGTS